MPGTATSFQRREGAHHGHQRPRGGALCRAILGRAHEPERNANNPMVAGNSAPGSRARRRHPGCGLHHGGGREALRWSPDPPAGSGWDCRRRLIHRWGVPWNRLGVESAGFGVVRPCSAEGWSNAELEEGLRELERLARRVEARRAELIAVAERRGWPVEGFGSTTAWLMALSGIRRQCAAAGWPWRRLCRRCRRPGRPLPPGWCPSPGCACWPKRRRWLPNSSPQMRPRWWLQVAAVPSPQLPQVFREWRRSTDPAGAEADAERLHGSAALHLSPAWSGMVHLSGDLDPEGGGVVLAAMRSLAEPAALDADDPRTPAQRRPTLWWRSATAT